MFPVVLPCLPIFAGFCRLYYVDLHAERRAGLPLPLATRALKAASCPSQATCRTRPCTAERFDVKSEDELIRMLATEVAEVAYSDFMETIPHVTKRLESPIERVFAMAWQARSIEGIHYFSDGEPLEPRHLLHLCFEPSTDWVGSINPQVTINNYRADFYLQAFGISAPWEPPVRVTGLLARLVIECDGHEFHERTKEQAARDRRRDRWFQTHGITVLRFTGSEIWTDPLGCIDQVCDAFFAIIKR